MVVEAGEVVDTRLTLHNRQESVALERERDLLRRRGDQVCVAGSERGVLSGDGEHAVDVLPEAERRDAELTHLERRLGGSGGSAENDRAETGVTESLAEWSARFEEAVVRDAG